jgi:hypothetical protein
VYKCCRKHNPTSSPTNKEIDTMRINANGVQFGMVVTSYVFMLVVIAFLAVSSFDDSLMNWRWPLLYIPGILYIASFFGFMLLVLHESKLDSFLKRIQQKKKG